MAVAAHRLILIGFADSLAAAESAWSLVDAGYAVRAFFRAGTRPALRKVSGIELVPITPPERDLAAACSDLRDDLARTRPAAVMPLDDAALCLCDRAVPEAGVPLLGPTGPTARLALDKGAQLDAARRAGLLVPPTEVVGDPGPSPRVAAALPVVVKSALAVVERDGALIRPPGRVCRDAVSMARALDGARRDSPLLVQPVLEGAGEGLFGLRTDGGVVAWSAHRRVRMMNPEGSGSSACAPRRPDESLVGPVERLLAGVGWNGLFMVEFLRDAEDRPWFMELNGRPWGSIALARRSGFEYPAWAARIHFEPGYRPAHPEQVPDIVCRHLGREIRHLAHVLAGRPGANRPGMRWRTVRDVVRLGRRDRWYNWRRGEAVFFVADTLGTLQGLVAKERSS